MTTASIRPAVSGDIPALTVLWKTCFTDDPAYLGLVFGPLFSLAPPFVLETEEGEILSSAFLLPLRYRNPGGSTSGYYLYGVCTRPDARGRGLARQIVLHLIRHAEAQRAGFLLTRPAEPALFDYYRALGFGTPIRNGLKTCPVRPLACTSASGPGDPPPTAAGPNPGTESRPGLRFTDATARLAGSAFAQLRERTFPDGFRWDPSMLDFIRQTLPLSGGAVLTCGGTAHAPEIYAAVQIDPHQPSCLRVTETNLPRAEIHSEAILRAAQTCFNARFRTLAFVYPAGRADISFDAYENFALLCPLNGFSGDFFKGAFFNFSME